MMKVTLSIAGITPNNVQSTIDTITQELRRLDGQICRASFMPVKALAERAALWWKLNHLYTFRKYGAWFAQVERGGIISAELS